MKKLFLVLLLTTGFIFPQKIIQFDYVGEFNEGMCPVKKDNKWGFIDVSGNVVVEPKYGEVYGVYPKYINGLCLVKKSDENKWGFIDKTGNEVIPLKFYSATSFYDIVAASYTPADAKNANTHARWRIIDRKGEILVDDAGNDHSYQTIVKEGRMGIKRGLGKEGGFKILYGFVDVKGKDVIPVKFQEVRDFSEGLAAVKLNDKWGFIDTLGNTVIDFQFTEEPMPFSNGRTFVKGTNYKFGLLDKTGKLLVEPTYKQVFPFNDGVATVSIMDDNYQTTFSIIDLNGKPVKAYKPTGKDKDIITFHSGFSEGLAVAQRGYAYEFGFIDAKGKVAIDYKFNQLKPFNSGLAYAETYNKKDNKTTKGFIDKKGKFVILIEKRMF